MVAGTKLCRPCLLEVMGKRVRVLGRVAVQKTHTDQTINVTDQYKCSHKLPVFDQCQQCFWFTQQTHLSSNYPHVTHHTHTHTHTHTQNTRFVFNPHGHTLVTIKFSRRHTAHSRTAAAAQRGTQNNCLHSMLYTGSHFILTT